MSREVAGVAVLGAAAAIIGQYLPGAMQSSVGPMTRLLGEFATLEPSQALRLAGHAVLSLVWPFSLAAALVGSLSVLVQTRFLIKTSALQPDFGKLNPMAGIARLLGPHNLMETGKSLLKIGAMGALAWHGIAAALPDMHQSISWPIELVAGKLGAHLTATLIPILAVQGAIAAADVLRSQSSFNASMRMTKQEQRDEQREGDGDPHVKQKLKQIRQQRSRKRMMQAVPRATVIVTNPTHYAVALAYERGSGGAPRIIAKGMDEVAARIREVGEKAGVPLIANPPLARALYPLALESEVPAEYFRAVAELIAYVWRLQTPVGRSVGP